MSDSFVSLHTHTSYSQLDGASKIPELVARAVELGMPGLGISDHGNLEWS
jgi:DNA polymerase-3 subunit alpha